MASVRHVGRMEGEWIEDKLCKGCGEGYSGLETVMGVGKRTGACLKNINTVLFVANL